jgi:nucleoside-diphosphate-sugar epimerase
LKNVQQTAAADNDNQRTVPSATAPGAIMDEAQLGPQRILVTGGWGFLGINLIRTLLARGWSHITSLDIAPFDYPECRRIRAIRADVRDRQAVREAMRGTSWVVHAAAASRRPGREIVSTDIVGTRIVLEAAHHARVDRVVYLSSAVVYGLPGRCPVSEDHALSGTGVFAAAKLRAE